MRSWQASHIQHLEGKLKEVTEENARLLKYLEGKIKELTEENARPIQYLEGKLKELTEENARLADDVCIATSEALRALLTTKSVKEENCGSQLGRASSPRMQ